MSNEENQDGMNPSQEREEEPKEGEDFSSGEKSSEEVNGEAEWAPSYTKQDYQLGRRAFHLINGILVASLYNAFFTRQSAISIIGAIACVIYLFEQFRIAYPELAQKASWLTNSFLRAEEQFRESSMLPYVIALLLTLITFPKNIALIAIYTLAVADPASALIGIKFGKYKIFSEKTLEGSVAFFAVAFLINLAVFHFEAGVLLGPALAVSAVIAVLTAAFEMLPIRIDDNLTIPLFIGFVAWFVCAVAGIPF